MTLWNQPYHAKGTFAAEIKLLAKPNLFTFDNKKYFFFNRYIDVVECGAIIGFRQYNDKEKFHQALATYSEKDDIDDLAEIPLITIMNEQSKIKFLFRMIMINERIRDLSLKDKTDNAFRNECNETIQIENEKLFNNFVKLGVRILYDEVKKAKDPEACLDLMTCYMSPED